jgi:hypothetical protein
MVTLVRIFAALGIVSGVICFAIGILGRFDADAVFYILCGLSGLLSGALLFCFAAIVDKLEAIRDLLDHRLPKNG